MNTSITRLLIWLLPRCTTLGLGIHWHFIRFRATFRRKIPPKPSLSQSPSYRGTSGSSTLIEPGFHLGFCLPSCCPVAWFKHRHQLQVFNLQRYFGAPRLPFSSCHQNLHLPCERQCLRWGCLMAQQSCSSESIKSRAQMGWCSCGHPVVTAQPGEAESASQEEGAFLSV